MDDRALDNLISHWAQWLDAYMRGDLGYPSSYAPRGASDVPCGSTIPRSVMTGPGVRAVNHVVAEASRDAQAAVYCRFQWAPGRKLEESTRELAFTAITGRSRATYHRHLGSVRKKIRRKLTK